MAKISSYGTVDPASDDKILGSDVSDTGNDAGGETVNFLVSGLSTLLATLTATLTNKTIDADDNTISNLALGAEVLATGIAADLVPDADGTRSLGSAANRWANVETDALNGEALETATGVAFVSASASSAAGIVLSEDTDNGTNKVTYSAPASVAADAAVTLPGVAGTVLSTGEAATLAKGFNASDYDAGTKSTGTFTPDPANGNFQKAVNGGAHTLAPPGSSCCMVVQITNNGSAGAITTSGFTKVTGDSFTTTDTHDFICHITRCNGFSHLHVTALQ